MLQQITYERRVRPYVVDGEIAWRLRFAENLSYREIKKRLRLPETVAESTIARAVARHEQEVSPMNS